MKETKPLPDWANWTMVALLIGMVVAMPLFA